MSTLFMAFWTTTKSLLDHLTGRLAGTGGPILVPVGDELGWPMSVVTSLAGFAGARRAQPAGDRTAIPAALR
jgi:hypothetical protein